MIGKILALALVGVIIVSGYYIYRHHRPGMVSQTHQKCFNLIKDGIACND